MTKNLLARPSAAVTLATLVLGATACGGSGSDPLANSSKSSGGGGTVTVGSANFPENVLLASIYSQALQAKGIKVTEKFNIGSREVIYGQVKSGSLTVLPEYNGSLLTYLKAKAASSDEAAVNAALAKALPSSLTLLDSSAAEDKDSLTVSKAVADKYNLKSIPDLKGHAADFVVGGPPEFKTRDEQLFKDVYGLTFKEWKATSDATANALKDGTVQVGDIYTTDPRIISLNLVSLEDPKHLFDVQNVTPLVHKGDLSDKGVAALNAVSAKLDTAGLVQLMKRVGTDKEDPAVVAKDWLSSNGLA
ncbi:ABC transporter substrate-binding protein [Actinacidiphila soli]|uniref:ABC transporter substrate-binding protein n=1 Tax=Actinacidiphila soli TaxID=2487275 RepID=UPI0019D24952|nr:ABC transporter substrate-binding protein [Actinacidiphila soli]